MATTLVYLSGVLHADVRMKSRFVAVVQSNATLCLDVASYDGELPLMPQLCEGNPPEHQQLWKWDSSTGKICLKQVFVGGVCQRTGDGVAKTGSGQPLEERSNLSVLGQVTSPRSTRLRAR